MNYSAEEFDEDVVIEGSELHRTLLQMGFTDFETVSPQKEINEAKIAESQNQTNNFEIFDKLYHIYNQVFKQDEFIIREKLLAILFLEPLLDDHASKIQELVSEKTPNYWRAVFEWLPIAGMSIATIISALTHQEKFYTILLASSAGFCLYNKSTQLASVHDLKTLVNLQNSFYSNVRKGLKILRNDYRLRKNEHKPGNKFLEFKKNHFKFLMPLLSSLIRSLEQISLLDYRISKHILSLLPPSSKVENVLTMFDEESFLLKDEVTYDNLKSLYYTYLLTQSEMLNLLALAYCQKSGNPGLGELEHKFNYLINHLAQRLKDHNTILSKILDDYNACDFNVVHRKFRGTDAKWQDVYLQLDVSSQKLQTSYFLISSILKRIDNQREENTNDEELLKMLSEKINETQKQVESANSFLTLATLLLMRRQHVESKTNDLEPNNAAQSSSDVLQPSTSMAQNFEHEILDEVFEEYIKEEYLKPFYEEDNDYFYDQKINKFLSKHYMQELKQVLVDKHKIMSEREARAFQRMYGGVLNNESAVFDGAECHPPPPPPPPPPPLQSSLMNSGKEDSVHKNLIITEPATAKKNVISINSLPTEEKEDLTLRFSMGGKSFLPEKPVVSFLQEEEEMFFGSGENSEEELVYDSSEKDS